jgi:hypothetical protein
LYLLETLKQKDIEVRVDPDCSIRLACPSVLENEGHRLLIDFKSCDGVPSKLDHLILKLSPLSAREEPERIKGNNRDNMAFFSCIGSTVRENYCTNLSLCKRQERWLVILRLSERWTAMVE